MDVKQGYGVMTWGDNSVYKGCWVDGIQDGLGMMMFANGIKKAGIFKKNELVELIFNIRCLSD